MRWAVLLVLLAACGSVEPIGPPESSGESFTTGDTFAGTTSLGTGDTETDGDTELGTSTGGTGGSSSSGGTTGTSTGAQVDGSGTDDCMRGEAGCSCLPNNGCAAGLVCASNFCVPDLPCPTEQAGMETCQCTDGGGCDEGLVCASDLCVDPG